VITIPQRHGRTDKRTATTCRNNNAVCVASCGKKPIGNSDNVSLSAP